VRIINKKIIKSKRKEMEEIERENLRNGRETKRNKKVILKKRKGVYESKEFSILLKVNPM
jgi:hypothetical protein